MSIIRTAITWLFKPRLAEVEVLKSDPVSAQERTLFDIISRARGTEWGRKYGFDSIKTIAEYQSRVPLSSYEDLEPYISRMMKGEEDILWPGKISWFSKSSGTTNARSKHIPVSKQALKDCHFKAGKDQLALYIRSYPDTQVLSGKSLFVGGSLSRVNEGLDIYCGDVSAVLMKNLPVWGEYLRTPRLETALLSDYEEKIERLARETSRENVTSIAGVPTWTSILIKKVVELNNAKDIFDVWPNLEVFFHGAVAFAPYRELFRELLPRDSMRYMETYNASEGFFAVQDDPSRDGEMLLMPDYGIFYEFIPMSEFGREDARVCTMAEVELNKNYALVISTNAGLWRYVIGDTVSFTTLFPHRIKITGRTKHFINAFGEEVVVHNADTAIRSACEYTGASITDYTAAPIYMAEGKRGGHEWVVEFERAPDSLERFAEKLDAVLREVNSDYDAKRYKDIALAPPVVHAAPAGTFYEWMRSRGKLGGQHKVPRLSNTREYVEELVGMMK